MYKFLSINDIAKINDTTKINATNKINSKLNNPKGESLNREIADTKNPFIGQYKEVNTNMIYIWNSVFISLQKIYDISSQKIMKLTSDTNIQKYYINEYIIIQQKIENDLLKEIQLFKDKSSLIDQNNTDNEIIKQFEAEWGHERCGFLLSQYNNGYRQYCNVHKYIHHEIIPITHTFVPKDKESAIYEWKFTQRLNIFRKYLTELHDNTLDYIINILLKNTSVIQVATTDIDQANDILKNNIEYFKLMNICDDGIINLYIYANADGCIMPSTD